MKSQNRSKLFSFSLAVQAVALLFVAGCSSDSRPVDAPPPPKTPPAPVQAGAHVSTMDTFKADLVDAKSQIEGALASLNKLTDPKTPAADLRGIYDGYADRLARITQQSEQIRKESAEMKDARAAYFAKWEEKASEIDNPTIRASAEARTARIRAGYTNITSASLAAKDAYEPFMRDLQDVRKFLAAELSPASVALLGDVTKKANLDGLVVKQKIDAVIAELNAVSGGGSK